MWWHFDPVWIVSIHMHWGLTSRNIDKCVCSLHIHLNTADAWSHRHAPLSPFYPPFPLLIYSSVVVCLRWLYCHNLSSITWVSQEHRGLVSIIDVQSMVVSDDRVHYGLLVVLVCLQITPSHYHLYADLSEGIELIKWLSDKCCRCGV